jgi:hypothetical protein
MVPEGESVTVAEGDCETDAERDSVAESLMLPLTVRDSEPLPVTVTDGEVLADSVLDEDCDADFDPLVVNDDEREALNDSEKLAVPELESETLAVFVPDAEAVTDAVVEDVLVTIDVTVLEMLSEAEGDSEGVFVEVDVTSFEKDRVCPETERLVVTESETETEGDIDLDAVAESDPDRVLSEDCDGELVSDRGDEDDLDEDKDLDVVRVDDGVPVIVAVSDAEAL